MKRPKIIVSSGPLHIGPRYSGMLGGKKTFISGPCFDNTNVIQCKFGDAVVEGRIIDFRTAECVTPMMGTTGTFPLTLSLDGGQSFPYEGKYFFGKVYTYVVCPQYFCTYISMYPIRYVHYL